MTSDTSNPSPQGMEDFITVRDTFGMLVPELGQLDVTDVTDRNVLVVMTRLVLNPTTEDPRSVEFPNEFGTVDRVTLHAPRDGEEDFKGAYVFETDHEGDKFSAIIARLISLFHADSMNHDLGE